MYEYFLHVARDGKIIELVMCHFTAVTDATHSFVLEIMINSSIIDFTCTKIEHNSVIG